MERMVIDPKRPLGEYSRIAEALGLQSGDEVEVEIGEHEVRLRRAVRSLNPDHLLAGRGMLAGRPDVTRDILARGEPLDLYLSVVSLAELLASPELTEAEQATIRRKLTPFILRGAGEAGIGDSGLRQSPAPHHRRVTRGRWPSRCDRLLELSGA